MSDNIDYAELDKAVNEAIKNRSAAEVKSSAKSVVKPVASTSVPHRVARPATAMHQSHGQFMDFVRRPNTPTAPSAVRPIARPVTPPVAAKPIARPLVQPTATKVTTAPRPAIIPRSAKIGTAVKPVRPSIATQIQKKQQSVASPRPTIAAKPITRQAAKPAVTVAEPATSAVKPTARIAAKPVAHPTVTKPTISRPAARPAVTKPTVTAKPATHAVATKPAPAKAKIEEKPVAKAAPKAEKAPNANNYSLGVRSPFMTNTKVDKRPLGKDIPETSASALESTKNIYSSKSPSKVHTTKKKHMVTEAPKKHSGWLWALATLLVIGAGAGLGYLAYILVFANQL